MSYDFLKPVLGEELFAQVDEKLSASNLNIINLSDGSYIPKAKFEDERAKVKALNANVADLTTKLKEATDKAGSAEDLQSQIDKLTKDIADKDATIASTALRYRIKDQLREMKARNVDIVMGQIDFGKIAEKDGKLTGLTEQVDALKKSDAYLFEGATNGARGGFGGSQDIGGGTDNNTSAAMNAAIRAASGRHTN